MNKKPYSSAIKKTPYKYTISKKIAKLILDGMDRNEVCKNALRIIILKLIPRIDVRK